MGILCFVIFKRFTTLKSAGLAKESQLTVRDGRSTKLLCQKWADWPLVFMLSVCCAGLFSREIDSSLTEKKLIS